jgi:ubiquinone/menaquinone biosynthesis C-methylase UbiE
MRWQMGVASHLGIDLADYDTRIRTFIPDYDTMLEAAAAAIPRATRVIVDLGTGTGALAARCLIHAPRAHIVGIDSDREILTMAARRLPARASFTCGSFLRTPLPAPCDAVVASFALHHVRTRTAKARLYRRLHRALGRRGVFVTVDCHPSIDRAAAREQREAWTAHLRRSYSGREADELLKAWSMEDVYVPLESEIGLMERAGFSVSTRCRRGAFAVLSATKRQ